MKRKILLVDGEPGILRSIKRILSRFDCEVSATTQPELALRLLEKDPFDLVLSDYHMPGMTGYALYKRVVETRPEMIDRFVFMNAGLPHDIQARHLLAHHQVLEKPFTFEEVEALVTLDR